MALYISEETQLANVRTAKFKVALFDLQDSMGLTNTEFYYCLADVLHDAHQRAFGAEKEQRDKDNGFDRNKR